MKRLLILLCIFSLTIPSLIVAQTIPAASIIAPITADDISVDLSNENPGANTTVVINIQSYTFDLNAAPTEWYVNGKKTASGKGIKRQTITTGALGVKTSVLIIISTPTGDIEKNISFIPATVDITWESLTYTPPFFKGKALFTNQSMVKFVALPHVYRNGVELAPANLIYTWSNNNTVLGDQSGYGKNTLSIAGAFIPRPLTVDVIVTDPVSGSTAAGSVSLAPRDPLVLIYKNDPLYGVQYEKALTGRYPLSEREIEVVAVPYYFSTLSTYRTNLEYKWQINGNNIEDRENSPTKVFRAVGDTFGTSRISISITHANKILQIGSRAMSIEFTKPTNQSVF